MTLEAPEVYQLRLKVVQQAGELAEARAWMRDAREWLYVLAATGRSLGGPALATLDALLDRCPLPDEESDDAER